MWSMKSMDHIVAIVAKKTDRQNVVNEVNQLHYCHCGKNKTDRQNVVNEVNRPHCCRCGKIKLTAKMWSMKSIDHMVAIVAKKNGPPKW